MKGKSSGHYECEFYKHYKGKRTKQSDILTAREVDRLEELSQPWLYGRKIGTEHVYETARKGRQGMQESDLKRLEREREAREQEKERRIAIECSQEATRRMEVLRHSREIEVTCRGCGHSHTFLFTQLARKKLAGKRFRCSQCGTLSAPFLPR